MGGQGWFRTTAAVALVMGGTVVIPARAGGQDPGTCSQPYAPVASVLVVSGGRGLPAVDADPVEQQVIAPNTPVDSDGDGEDDVLSGPGTTTAVTRSDGTVAFQSPASTPLDAYGVGDINGDGRDEIGLNVLDTAGGSYLVPGTIGPGTHDPEVVGIHFALPALKLMAVEDGTDRLLAIQIPGDPPNVGGTWVYDGPSALALGAGGDGSSLTPTTSYDGMAALIADLGDPTRALVLARTEGEAEGRTVEVVIDRSGDLTRLTTAPEPSSTDEFGPFEGFSFLDGPDGTFLLLTQSSRSGTGAYLWSLTDPCTPLAAEAAPPAAPPAAPVEAEATFTG